MAKSENQKSKQIWRLLTVLEWRRGAGGGGDYHHIQFVEKLQNENFSAISGKMFDSMRK